MRHAHGRALLVLIAALVAACGSSSDTLSSNDNSSDPTKTPTSGLQQALLEADVVSEASASGGLCFATESEVLGFVAEQRCFVNPLTDFVAMVAQAPASAAEFSGTTVVMAVMTPDVTVNAVEHRTEFVPYRVEGQVLLFGLKDLQDFADVTVAFTVVGREGSCAILGTGTSCDVSDLS